MSVWGEQFFHWTIFSCTVREVWSFNSEMETLVFFFRLRRGWAVSQWIKSWRKKRILPIMQGLYSFTRPTAVCKSVLVLRFLKVRASRIENRYDCWDQKQFVTDFNVRKNNGGCVWTSRSTVPNIFFVEIPWTPEISIREYGAQSRLATEGL